MSDHPPEEKPSLVRRVLERTLAFFDKRSGHAVLGVVLGALVTAIIFLAVPVLTDAGFIRKTDLGKEWVRVANALLLRPDENDRRTLSAAELERVLSSQALSDPEALLEKNPE